MTQPKKLTVPALQAQIVKRQSALLRQIASRHAKKAQLDRQLAELDGQIADLHGQLFELPATMVDVWDLGRRASYAVRAERAS